MNVDVSDVEDVLSTDRPMSRDDIVRAVLPDGVEDRCPHCHRRTSTFEDVDEQVGDALGTLLSRGTVTSTPDWEYRLAK